MTTSIVEVCSSEDTVKQLPELCNRIGFKLGKLRLALIKPNICGLYHPSIKILYGAVRFLLTGVRLVIIGETSSMVHDPEDQFRRLGILNLVKNFGGNVVALDLSNDEWMKVKVPNPHVLREIELPKKVLESDLLINIPRAGTHSTTLLTCASKNLFGLLPQKHKYSIYHPLGIDKVVADIAQTVRPHLNIVDMGNRVIIGSDILTVDIVACKFIGLDPLKIEHLRLIAHDRGENLEKIKNNIQIKTLKEDLKYSH
ncbi:MAG: DUF362 domain-containing protein [Candidatus Bathyarchaeia archaeon]|nr:DUF362 domain-containing protein [Candidatus Bathyarchaeota archaeon]